MRDVKVILYRINSLKEWDNYIRNAIEDEEVFEFWLAEGVPDGADEEDFKEIAEDDELWEWCREAFKVCMKIAKDNLLSEE